ncbi:11215_t:CDS:1 [Diversispora eburnea]|uniref:11215_t:CDS:1 n=1 Tax=Diversispora eburnea TaxID=1213867 RepID=A0A9N9D3Y8_9GLOM|nr:11215_t:CDS:1 [Diversispora eburnea]
MHSFWRPDIKFPITKSLTVHKAYLAYMDHITWIVLSKSNLQVILNDATQFYHANDSQVNGSKLQVIAVNFKEKKINPIYIGQDRDEVHATSKHEFVQFLEVWFREKSHKKNTVELVQREIDRITRIIRYKSMTNKQVHYIISQILLSRIEYRMINSHINLSICKRLIAKYSQIFKNSIQVTYTISNSAIRYSGIYNLKSISELQNELQINGLIHRLNDTGSVDTSTFIHLKDLQLANWESTNILTNNNLFDQILNTVHSLEINFQSPCIQELFQ